jgi:ADP-ribose pyrophosphatase
MKPIQTLSHRTVLDMGKFLKVEEHTVRFPDGHTIDDWPWIVTPDFVNVVPVTTDGRVLLFRQTKYAVEGVSLAPVGGYLEPDEESLDCARRELMEETGYEAQTWLDLGAYRVDANRGAGTAFFYLATGAVRVQEPDADDLEEQELISLSLDETKQALADARFRALPWTSVVALALIHLGQ